MKITQVYYERLQSFGNFANETIGAHVAVDPGESPEDALRYSRAWVDGELAGRIETEQRERDEARLRYDLTDLEDRVAAARSKWERVEAFLAKHGVAGPYDDLPF